MREISQKSKLLIAVLAVVSPSGCASTKSTSIDSAVTRPARVAAPPVGSVVERDRTWNDVLVEHDGLLTGAIAVDHQETVVPAPPVGAPNNQLPQPVVLDPGHELVVADPAVPEATNAQPVEHYVAIALERHPSIQAARARVTAEASRMPQVRALPDPQFKNTFWPIQEQAIQTAAGRVGNQMSVSQAIPWPEKLKTKAAIVNQEVQIARAEVEREQREVAEAVRLAYYEVWYASTAIRILQQSRELVDDLITVAEARYRSGGTQQDVIRAKLESDRLDNQLVGLRKQKRAAQADLAALLQQPSSLTVETVDTLDLVDVPKRMDELIRLAQACNPELSGLQWEIQRDRQKQRLACLQRYPDLQVGLHWGLVSDDANVISPVANGHDTVSFDVGTTLPIWRKKISAGVREASYRTGSAVHRFDAHQDALFGKLRRLLAQADAMTQQRDIFRDRIIPRTENTLELSIADYRGKRADFFSVIETHRELLMFEMQLARIEASLAGTLAQMERAVGCSK